MYGVSVYVIGVKWRWFRPPLIRSLIGRQEFEGGPIEVREFEVELGTMIEIGGED